MTDKLWTIERERLPVSSVDVVLLKKFGSLDERCLDRIEVSTKEPPYKWKPEHGFSYRHKRDANDPLANWQSRETVVRWFSQEIIEEAEKKCALLVKRAMRAASAGRKTEVYKELERKVKELGLVTSYKMDMEFHDAFFLSQNPKIPFAFCARESGTYLFMSYDKGLFDYILRENEHRLFAIFDGTKLLFVEDKKEWAKTAESVLTALGNGK